MDEKYTCGVEHPERPGVFCERVLCLEYHRSGTVIWTQGAQKMPTMRPNTERMAGVVRRTRARARSTDPATSHQAARSLGDLTHAQFVIRDLLAEHGPMTDEEIWGRLEGHQDENLFMTISGARTRRKELVDAGRVEDSGQRKLTQAGRRTIVWRVKER